MKNVEVCPGTLAEGYDKYSPSCVRNMFDGKQVCPFLDFSYDANHEDFVASVNRLSISGVQEKLSAIAVIAQHGMSVARTERYVEQLLEQTPEPAKKANLGAFFNHLNQSLAKIQLSGIPAVSERRETESEIVLTITIQK